MIIYKIDKEQKWENNNSKPTDNINEIQFAVLVSTLFVRQFYI